jgi:hypothetical protein
LVRNTGRQIGEKIRERPAQQSALVATYAARKSIVDEQAARAAINEITDA